MDLDDQIIAIVDLGCPDRRRGKRGLDRRAGHFGIRQKARALYGQQIPRATGYMARGRAAKRRSISSIQASGWSLTTHPRYSGRCRLKRGTRFIRIDHQRKLYATPLLCRQ
jgi:hypothetical protein